jgi:hypothetical protein
VACPRPQQPWNALTSPLTETLPATARASDLGLVQFAEGWRGTFFTIERKRRAEIRALLEAALEKLQEGVP